MLFGLLLFALGAFLMLRSYSSHAVQFNIGFALGVIGVVLAIVAGFMQDRRRQLPRDDNGDASRQRP